MSEFISKHWAYLIGAVLLHLAFAAVFGLTMINIWSKPLKPTLAIQAVVVDRNVIDQAARKQQRDRQQERERQQAEQRKQQEKREAEQRAEQERQQEQKQREQEQQRRQAEEQQARERQETERKAAAEADRQRKAEAERKRVAEIERKQKEEAERRKAAEDAKVQQQREADLKSQMAEEEGRNQAANAGLLNQYIAMIQQAIERNWSRPPSARPGLECTVKVAQTPTGTVLSAKVDQCNGDAAVKQSIEAAVLKASPLPQPPDPRVFERNLVFVFKPQED
ncbi:MAG TPA: cell envelope integrity protein TolA [Steroidobacteraceae bacterium]|jgi:colicin import membrane protein|nr:cell envelope integrity protein TolA [Steroidobacteraceae bacterium]